MHVDAAVSCECYAQHGGRLAAAMAQFPAAPQPWIDLSTGINRRSYPAPVASVDERRSLPQADRLAALECTAAAAFGVADATRVVAIAGTELAIRLLPSVLQLRDASILGPTYSSHADAWDFAAARVTQISALQLRSTVESVHALTIVNPNNPDGRSLEPERLLALHDQLAPHGALIVDEAFVEVRPEISVAELAGSARAPRLIVLRSFGKFFGLAGVRLGFLVASTAIVSRLRRLIGDWPVSVDAIAAGCAAYPDRRWADETRAWLTQQSGRLDSLLARVGFDIVGGTSLYRLARAANAAQRFQTLLRAGILTRPFDYDRTLLRFGLPDGQDEWDRLAAAADPR